VTVRPLLELVPDWDAFVGQSDAPDFGEMLHAHARTGRPLGPDSFVESLERRFRRSLKRGKPGPKPRERDRATRDLFADREENYSGLQLCGVRRRRVITWSEPLIYNPSMCKPL
jgi:hypothetical protein